MKNRFKEIRKNENLNQEQLASELNLSRGQIACYETGRRTITDRTIKDVCSKYNINEEWLRTGDGEMKKEEPEVDELSLLMGMFNPEEDEFKTKIITTLLKLEDNDWLTIKKIVNEMLK